MTQAILIHGHPDKDSFCMAEVIALQNGLLHQGYEVKIVHAYDYPLLSTHPAKEGFPAAFLDISDNIPKADFIAIFFPLWNFGVPGGLKNFLDGAFQAQKSFHYESNKIQYWLSQREKLRRFIPAGIPKGDLKAKKVLLVSTADGPKWYYQLFFWKNSAFTMLRSLFKFCGVKKFEVRFFGGFRASSDAEKIKWLQDLEFYKTHL